MRLNADGTLLLSPSDLSGHLACPHLTTLNLRVQRGKLERPHVDDTHGDLIRRKGDEHEAAFRAGEADVIYQPYLSDGTWRGFADFLEKVVVDEGEACLAPTEETRTAFYEAVDTKLARSAKPAHVLQLCFYSEQLGRIQGKLPERFHVELGTGERETFRTADHMAHFRRSRERFLEALDTSPATY